MNYKVHEATHLHPNQKPDKNPNALTFIQGKTCGVREIRVPLLDTQTSQLVNQMYRLPLQSTHIDSHRERVFSDSSTTDSYLQKLAPNTIY